MVKKIAFGRFKVSVYNCKVSNNFRELYFAIILKKQLTHLGHFHLGNNNNNGNPSGAGGNGSGRSSPSSNSDSSPGKLFVGGLSWQTTPEKLREYFCQFGQVSDVLVMKDPVTQVQKY